MSDHEFEQWEDRTQRGADGGTVFRGEDGSLYFVRDELLEALKVQGEGLERLEEALKSKTKGVEAISGQGAKASDAKGGGGLRSVAYVRGSLLREDPRNQAVKLNRLAKAAVPSTVMCPWFC